MDKIYKVGPEPICINGLTMFGDFTPKKKTQTYIRKLVVSIRSIHKKTTLGCPRKLVNGPKWVTTPIYPIYK